jgi:hypothetical protein
VEESTFSISQDGTPHEQHQHVGTGNMARAIGARPAGGNTVEVIGAIGPGR